jgi:cobalamin-dependent methionine synthase I
MINSINGENSRLEKLIPIIAENKCQVIALAMDEKGIPSTANERVAVIQRVIEEANTAGITDENIYVDPLVMTISTNIQNGLIFFDTLKTIRSEFPKIHFVAGISNISFGLPVRSHVNRFFLAFAMEAGLDTAILDPLDQELKAAILITEMLLGKDNYCLNFTKAFREGVFNKVSKNSK